MSWMTPAPTAASSDAMVGLLRILDGPAGRGVREQLDDPVPALAEPVQRQAESGDRSHDQIERVVALQRDQQLPARTADGDPELVEVGGKPLDALVHLHHEDVAAPG